MRDLTDQHEEFETVGADAPTETADPRHGADDRSRDSQASDTEADILRSELDNATSRVGELEAEVADAKDRYVRSRAEFDTFRRRMADELNMAREAGLDSVMLPVLGVYDDLERAVAAASTTTDPTTILPGVIAVRDGLIRNLESLGIRRVGNVGEQFDPAIHEALAVVPPSPQFAENVIAQVYEIGFVKGDRLIRPARVVVAKSS
ncbi:MAG TPA: nucleotide exchange factor GrpE [Trueperaceae bacterium]|nr:nucleotide exchange factor GrpE [Trueperaceae bacterium]